MDIINYYIAKDGTRFEDPLECQDYERKLGHPNGTVGRAKIDIEKFGKDKYIHGTLKVIRRLDPSKRGYHLYSTRCIDHELEDYVNVEDINEDKRWITSTFANVLNDLNRYDDDDLCEYEFLYSDNKQFHKFGICRTENKELWDILFKELYK